MSEQFGEVTSALIEELKEVCGEKYVLYGDREKLEDFSHDEVAEKEYHHYPECVVKPRTAQEVSAILKIANRDNVPVTPRGAGSGLSGGAIPVFGGIVISAERMDSIIEIDLKNLIAVVEPGIITNDLNAELEKHGLFFAGYPMSLESCYIGGNVAENAGGGKAIKYGVTSRYIYGLEMVLPTGEIVQFGGKCMKDVTGYDMVHLMVGSEGTLGFFTKIFVKLLPIPRFAVDLLVPFEDVQTAMDSVVDIMTRGKIIPTAVEFMDVLSVNKTAKFLNVDIPYENAGAYLIVELDSNDEDSLMNDYETVGELCLEKGAIDVFVADNAPSREKLWVIRRNIAEALKGIYPHQSLEDVVVPIAGIPEFVEKLQLIGEKYGIEIPTYGHAGDGNLHVTPIMTENVSEEEWKEKLPQVLEDIYRLAVSLGGTLSGEHGIGNKRNKYLSLALNEDVIDCMKKIKAAFDPKGIFNPGKIFE